MLIPLSGYPKYVFSVVPPSGDQTGAQDTAAINAIAQAGKVALLRAGTYYVGNLLPDSLGGIAGVGNATLLQAVSGTTGNVIALKTPASTYQVLLADFAINADVSGLGGIHLDNTGFGGGHDTNNDSAHTLSNISVFAAGADAFSFGNNIRSMRADRLLQYNGTGNGFNIGSGTTDCFFTGCVSGVSADHGWLVAGGNNMFACCKAFYAGYDGSFDTTHCGWDVSGGYNTIVSCEGQASALHGINLTGNCNSVTACEFDTNNQGGSGGVAINIDGSEYSAVIGNLGGQIGTETQLYGVQVTGTNNGTWIIGNSVTGTDGALNYVSGGGYYFIGATEVDFGQINSVNLPSGVTIGSNPFYSGTGAPNIPGSPAGSYYFRTDTPGTSDQRIYVATATNTWTGII